MPPTIHFLPILLQHKRNMALQKPLVCIQVGSTHLPNELLFPKLGESSHSIIHVFKLPKTTCKMYHMITFRVQSYVCLLRIKSYCVWWSFLSGKWGYLLGMCVQGSFSVSSIHGFQLALQIPQINGIIMCDMGCTKWHTQDVPKFLKILVVLNITIMLYIIW